MCPSTELIEQLLVVLQAIMGCTSSQKCVSSYPLTSSTPAKSYLSILMLGFAAQVVQEAQEAQQQVRVAHVPWQVG
jgi:hypothetical protein